MAKQEVNNYSFKELIFNLDQFDGPMDVLVEMIKEKKLDIMTLDIAELTHQYLVFVNNNLQYIAIDDASSYLVMASYLTELKTKILLPTLNSGDVNNETEFEIDKLRRQIFLYKQYKDMVDFFRARQQERIKIIAKKCDDLEEYIPDETPEAPLPDKVPLEKLVMAWQRVLFRKRDNDILNMPTLIKVNSVDVDKIQEELIDFVSTNNIENVSFTDFLTKFSKQKQNLELTCAIFVSLLVLVKDGFLKLEQQEQYGTIYISKNKNIDFNDQHEDIMKALAQNKEIAKLAAQQINFDKTDIYEIKQKKNKKEGDE